MRLILAVCVIVVVLVVIAARAWRAPTTPPAPVQPDATPLAAGQRWRYQTRPQEPQSTLVIGRVEESKIGRIYHVYVEGLALRIPSEQNKVICHMPFLESALRRSVTSLAGASQAPPSFEEGYATWKSEADAGRAGSFTVTVAEAVDMIEQTALRGRTVDEAPH